MTFRDQFASEWGWDTVARIKYDREMDNEQQMSDTPQWMKDWVEQWQSNKRDEQ